MNGSRRQRALSLAVIASLLLVATCDQAIGQGRRLEVVRLYGRVQWVAANQMLLTTDCTMLDACNPVSVVIDLRRVPLGDYRNLREGSRVFVEAIVSHDESRHRFVAMTVREMEDWQAP